MDAAIISAVLSAITGIVIAIVETRRSKDAKRIEERAHNRAEESRLSMALMEATCMLAIVTAKKVTNKEVNGDMEEALEAARLARKDYDKFVGKAAANHINEE